MSPGTRPADDPLLAAGWQQCPVCGRISWPIDATWLDEHHVLATFDRICTHHTAQQTKVLDVEQLTESDLDTALYTTGRRCAGVTSRGAACHANAPPGFRYCVWHRSQADVEADATDSGGR